MKEFVFTTCMAIAMMISTSAMSDDNATTTTTSKGQKKHYRKGKGQGRKMGMLSPEKRQKVKAIMDSLKKESESLRKQMKEIRAKLEALRDKKMQELKSVLTEDEFKKFHETMKRRRKRNHPKGKGGKYQKTAENSDAS